MFMTWPLLVSLGLGVFLIGTVVGSFLNVCIYRIPWEKSVIWPGSRCPICYSDIAARDNIPVISWIALRGECRSCGAKIRVRYLLVESLVGTLFLATYFIDMFAAPRGTWGQISPFQLAVTAYHDILIALLVAATLIDYDLWIIPETITITGWILGIGLGTLWPHIRPAPADAATHLGGFGVGLLGLLVGTGLTQAVRLSFGFILRSMAVLFGWSSLAQNEAMGFGDVMLMGVIGAVSRMAGRRARLFHRSVFWTRARGMETVEAHRQVDERRPIIRPGSRTSLRALLEHGGCCGCARLAVVMAELGERPLPDGLHPILVVNGI